MGAARWTAHSPRRLPWQKHRAAAAGAVRTEAGRPPLAAPGGAVITPPPRRTSRPMCSRRIGTRPKRWGRAWPRLQGTTNHQGVYNRSVWGGNPRGGVQGF